MFVKQYDLDEILGRLPVDDDEEDDSSSEPEEPLPILDSTNTLSEMSVYRNGGDGFIQWVEDFCYLPVYPPGSDIPVYYPANKLPDEPDPTTGRSYRDMWENQKVILRQALRMVNGRFVHRLICFSWPRGEGKSAVTVLIQMWKFFCWPKQAIMLGANSKDQTKFVHYDIIRDIIVNSPRLLAIIGERNIQEKEIRLLDDRGHVVCFIRSISSFSGIVSNITGYTFSEMFEMKKPKFFSQLNGSTRNVPNALGIIDSTVSPKDHILYQLYESFVAGKDPHLFFSYRYSLEAKQEDYWHPNQTQAQLDHYRSTMPMSDFKQYFNNVWNTGVSKMFSWAQVHATQYIGVDNALGGGPLVIHLLQDKYDAHERILNEKALDAEDFVLATWENKIREAEARLWPIDQIYSLRTPFGTPKMATAEDLKRIGDMLNTDWSVGAGLDRADPLKDDIAKGARTILTVTAKGLVDSRGRGTHVIEGIPLYVYFLLHLKHVESSDLNDIKIELLSAKAEYDGIDSFCSERWGVWDMAEWCEENEIKLEIASTAYSTQREEHNELYQLLAQGRFKAPIVSVPGVKEPNILIEEALMFDHDLKKKWYGSPEKELRNGVQDDTIYSLSHSIYGMRGFNVSHFRSRAGTMFWGTFIPNTDNIGRY